MTKLAVFNSISLDGYFTGAHGDLSWAHNQKPDPEWDAYVSGNAGGGGVLLFGRVTYDLMVQYWPTPLATQQNPAVAEGMNRHAKVVFSRTMQNAAWNNTRLVRGDLVEEIGKMKQAPENAEGMVILGSGSIVAQLAEAGLIDEFQLVMVPVILGGGRTLFEGTTRKLNLKLQQSRTFANGNVVSTYVPAA